MAASSPATQQDSTATPTRQRGPYAKTAARREQILRTALDEFAVRGFRASSLREIADQVGLSQAGILHHFSSKEALLAAVLIERDGVSAVHFDGRSDGIVVLDAVRDVVVSNLAQPGLVRLYTTLSAEATDPAHPAHAYFTARYDGVRKLVSDALTRGQRTGEVSKRIDPVTAASTLLALIDGLQIQWLLDESFDMLAAYDAFIVTFRRQIEGATK